MNSTFQKIKRNQKLTMKPGGLINLVTQSLASGQYFVLIYSGDKLVQKQAVEIIH